MGDTKRLPDFMQEEAWDKKLNITTYGRDDLLEDENHFPYEPTPYIVLERLYQSGYLSKEDTLLDYGCGKGRVGLFLSWRTGCHSIGIDFDERMIRAARQNQISGLKSEKTGFILADAGNYEVSEDVNRIFFFNPFSVKVLQSVIARITKTWYAFPREILLFFYYPSDEYMGKLMTEDSLDFVDEIDCSDLFEENKNRERIMIFKVMSVYE